MVLPHTDATVKTIFQQGCICSVFKRSQSLQELLATSLNRNKKFVRTNSVTSCNKFDICRNHIFCSNCITKRKSHTTRVLHSNCNSLIYLITCKKFFKQYAGAGIRIALEYLKAI